MKIFKATFLMLTSIIVISLAGCSTFNTTFPPSPEEQALKKHALVLEKKAKRTADCNDANVLLSNLTKEANQRVYSVKPGEVCYG